jgi:hypothetical protein
MKRGISTAQTQTCAQRPVLIRLRIPEACAIRYYRCRGFFGFGWRAITQRKPIASLVVLSEIAK